jgi:tetratricopeptide (TPR) repeat protein
MTVLKEQLKVGVILGTTLFLSACGGTSIEHPNRLRAAEHLGSAQELLRKNHPGQAILSVKKALARHQMSADFPATISDMNRLARLRILTGRYDRASEWIDRALFLEALGEFPALKAETLLLGAEIAPPDSANHWIAEAQKNITSLAGTQGNGRQRLLSRLYQVQGERLSLQKHYRPAVDLYKKAQSIDEARGDELSQATDLAGIGRNALLSGTMGEAQKAFGKARKIDQSLHNPSGLAFDLEGLALVHLAEKNYRAAARELMTASGIQEALGHKKRAQKDIESIKTFSAKIGALPQEELQTILDGWGKSGEPQE